MNHCHGVLMPKCGSQLATDSTPKKEQFSNFAAETSLDLKALKRAENKK